MVHTMTPYTAADLAAIRERAEAATAGPWFNEDRGVWALQDSRDWYIKGKLQKVNRFYLGVQSGGPDSAPIEEQVANAAFIAAAREDVPRLVAELTRARAALRLALPWVCAYVSDPPAADEAQAAVDAVVAALGEETDDGDTER